MELKPGYKQTEVGVIPDNWRVETINQLLEDKSILGHLDGNHGELYPRSSEFKQHGVPYIGANDFAEGFVTFERCKFLSKERAAQFRKGVAKDGDVLFAHNATVGPVALLRTSEPFVILSTTATYFRCDEEKLSNIYLKSALHSPHFVKQYQAVMAQSTRFQVPITAQRKLSLVIPPLPEQRAIAGALSDADALIGALDSALAKKRDLKQAAMQQLLTANKRLPGFSAEWRTERLGNVGKITMGQSPPGDSYTSSSSGMPLLNGAVDLTQDGIKVSQYTKSPTRVSQKGDLLFCIRATIGNLQIADREYCLGRGVAALTVDAAYDSKFIEYRLKTLFNVMYSRSEGGVIKGLRKDDVGEFRIDLPIQRTEQTAIAEVLSDMDAEMAALTQRRGKTRALKQGMMQELLTGRTRLV